MDLEICLEKLQRVGVLNFATVAEDGAPQIRNISAIHYEKDGLYFFTARGKEFCGQLLHDGCASYFPRKLFSGRCGGSSEGVSDFRAVHRVRNLPETLSAGMHRSG